MKPISDLLLRHRHGLANPLIVLTPTSVQFSQFTEEIAFIFDDMIIWDRGQEADNLRPLGFPTVFRINRIGEFILIFQKPSERVHLNLIEVVNYIDSKPAWLLARIYNVKI